LRNIIGYAKNDVLEIIIGVLLNIVGGVFIGSVYANPGSILFWCGAIGFTCLGIIFEVRVVAKHSYELNQMKKELELARKENLDTIQKMKNQQTLVDTASDELKSTVETIKETKEQLKEMEGKTFSRFSMGSGRPLEDDIDRLHNRLQVVEEKLGISTFLKRRLGRR